MQSVGGGRAPADQHDADPPGGGGVTVGHGDRDVFVPGAVEGDADGVQRNGEDGGVVAHQAEHHLDAEVAEDPRGTPISITDSRGDSWTATITEVVSRNRQRIVVRDSGQS